ncbi:MAG: lipase family protein [Cyanobacteria bacterium J06621_11]
MNYKTALQCAILSQEVYQDFQSENIFKSWPDATFLPISRDSTDTQLAILTDPSSQFAVIVFRGSKGEKDWNTNIRFNRSEYQWSRAEKREYKEQMEKVSEIVSDDKNLTYPNEYAETQSPVKMHDGFVQAYLSVREEIHNHINKLDIKQYRITGHSLGGALAKLCAIDLQYNFSPDISVEAYSFGAPRVGNKAFTESYNRRVPNTWRVVNGWDAVVGLPAPWQGYRHVETPIKLERRFTWKIITGSFEDHRIINYIEALRSRT